MQFFLNIEVPTDFFLINSNFPKLLNDNNYLHQNHKYRARDYETSMKIDWYRDKQIIK